VSHFHLKVHSELSQVQAQGGERSQDVKQRRLVSTPGIAATTSLIAVSIIDTTPVSSVTYAKGEASAGRAFHTATASAQKAQMTLIATKFRLRLLNRIDALHSNASSAGRSYSQHPQSCCPASTSNT
jgi:hypothetical protein